jgi:aromatic ring-cleaving dioxygenase
MSENKGYHAHVYYDAETKAKAAKLSATLIGKFRSKAARSATSRAAHTRSRSST